MERILSDFRRKRAKMLVICSVIAAAVCAAVWLPLLFSGGWAEWLRWVCISAAGIISAAMIILLSKAFAETLIIAPKKLAAQISAMPEQEKSEVIAAYPQAKALGERWFLPEHILFYTNRRAVILRYDAIKTISPQNGDLRLGTSYGDMIMPVRSGENPGIIYALLRDRNPAIKPENSGENNSKAKGHNKL